MTQDPRPPRRESALALVRRLIGGGIALAKLELAHGRQEIGERIGSTLKGGIFFGLAAAFALLALIAFVALLIFLVGLFLPLWASALIWFAVFVLVAIVMAVIGKRRVRSPVPEETIASVKEDIAWAKRVLKRG